MSQNEKAQGAPEGFVDFDALAETLNGLIEHIRSCTTSTDLSRWSKEGFRSTIDILGTIEANVAANIRTIDEIGCACPVCAAARTHLLGCQNGVSDLKTRMAKYVGTQSPFDAMLLLGTTASLLVTVPDLIEIASDLAQQAHDMGRAIIMGKIVDLSAEKHPCAECGDCDGCDDGPDDADKKPLN